MSDPSVDANKHDWRPAADTEPAIHIEGLDFSYHGSPVLENVHLSLRSGELVSMVGPNGGGKTTLLRLILGLEQPDRGRIRIFGAPPVRVRNRIGYMPQHIRHDPAFPATVMDVVFMGPLGGRLGGPYTRDDHEAARKALEDVDLISMADHPFADLSGGQRQRVLIARALATQPDLLLLDEPTANIDPRSEHQLVGFLKRLNRRMTIVLVTHDLGFVSGLVHSVVCVNRKVYTHPTSEVTGELIQEVYGTDMRLIRHDQHHTWHGDRR